MKSGAPLKRSPLARKTGLKAKPKKRMTTEERAAARAFKEAVAGQPCAVCGWLSETYMKVHHVVYRQHLARGDWWRTENALPVCEICHEHHHSRVEPIRREALTEQNLNFASEVLKAAAGTYLARYYA